MSRIIDNPFAVFFIALIAQWGSAFIGDHFRRKLHPLKEGEQADFDTVLTASLTLLALIIGFSFSMAVSSYDQRKNSEEAEANAIRTEYIRADLLPAHDAAEVRELLRAYIKQRISFYLNSERGMSEVDTDAAKLQTELWSSIVRVATAQPTPVVALAISGMNEVLSTQGRTQAAQLNRIPVAAWCLMGLIAICSNLLLGYRERSRRTVTLLVLPIIASIAFFLIADIDSPRAGIINVVPHNLIATSQSMKTD
ncbi:MAG: hypothetical protein WCD69_10695 [Xanthobacteraceae bacterium]